MSTASVPDIAQMKSPVRNDRLVKNGSVNPITEYAGSYTPTNDKLKPITTYPRKQIVLRMAPGVTS
ncbi:hypothetical protein [Halosimplex pelagicum]|uniref:Uncharacterized protein n=1 Tax=Halosimplex pelagicum TaxID=869886 RepID=A0A7D5PBE5_9EURY|nr:hypothetical protein [Halosimplex pelagicum]QLH82425.1 hypothetical protein HZS54_12720 [Halosimplex pelagicum]